VPLVTLQKLW